MLYPGIWGTDSISTFTSLNTCVLNKCVIVSYIKNCNAINACRKNLVEILRITKFGFLEYYVSKRGLVMSQSYSFFERGRGR